VNGGEPTCTPDLCCVRYDNEATLFIRSHSSCFETDRLPRQALDEPIVCQDRLILWDINIKEKTHTHELNTKRFVCVFVTAGRLLRRAATRTRAPGRTRCHSIAPATSTAPRVRGHATLLCCALLYATLFYSTLLCSALLYATLLYSTLRYSALLYATLLCSALLHSTLRHAMPCHAILYYASLRCAATSLLLLRYITPSIVEFDPARSFCSIFLSAFCVHFRSSSAF
jgi:hypothetical protein